MSTPLDEINRIFSQSPVQKEQPEALEPRTIEDSRYFIHLEARITDQDPIEPNLASEMLAQLRHIQPSDQTLQQRYQQCESLLENYVQGIQPAQTKQEDYDTITLPQLPENFGLKCLLAAQVTGLAAIILYYIKTY